MAGLQAYANAVSNPSSLLYRQFLSPEQVGTMFGPSASDVQTVIDQLKSNSVKVTFVNKSGLTVFAEGTVSNIQKAFKTTVSTISVDGVNVRTNLTSLMAPSSVASKIQSVDGIDNSITFKRRATTTLLTPPRYQGAYGLTNAYSSGFTGKGVNIAFANWDGLRTTNLPYWYSAYSLPTPSGGVGSNVTFINATGSGTAFHNSTPQGEGDLDLQMICGTAPLANIYVYESSTADGAPLTRVLSRIQSDNIADIVSESWGWATYRWARIGGTWSGTYTTSTFNAAHTLHVAMTAQGITYMAATGDTGTDELKNVNSGTTSFTRYGYPAIEPEVLQVGGSVATIDTITGARSVEKSWGLSGGYAGTGGYNPYDSPANGFAYNTTPSWQSSKLATQSAAHPYRLLPDLAAHASGADGLSPYGWIIYYNYGTSNPLGTQVYMDGTSASSPATAGSLGIVLQRLFAGVTPNSSRSNVRLGRIQDYLYLKGGNTSVFYDITTGTTIGNLLGTSTPATPAAGWDYATGWGSLNFDGLYHSFFTGKK